MAARARRWKPPEPPSHVVLDLITTGLPLKGRRDRPRLIFVTPSHQIPDRRADADPPAAGVLAFANAVGSAVIEDDYDSEFHYDGKPVAALQGLDDSGSVVLCRHLLEIDVCGRARRLRHRAGNISWTYSRPRNVDSGQIVSAPLQNALAEFIDDGQSLAAHIRKMTRIYRARRDRLVQALPGAKTMA